jgi:hypothetical protein
MTPTVRSSGRYGMPAMPLGQPRQSGNRRVLLSIRANPSLVVLLVLFVVATLVLVSLVVARHGYRLRVWWAEGGVDLGPASNSQSGE